MQKSVSKKSTKRLESVAKYRFCKSGFMPEKCLTKIQPKVLNILQN